MSTNYEKDVAAWSTEQAALLRAGRLSEIDVQHIAEEIEDVGNSQERELASRMSVLLMHLLKWKYQPTRQSRSWQSTISTQRKSVLRRLKKTPSLRPKLIDPEWIEDVWDDARLEASKETQVEFDTFPEACPWDLRMVLTDDWMPE